MNIGELIYCAKIADNLMQGADSLRGNKPECVIYIPYEGTYELKKCELGLTEKGISFILIKGNEINKNSEKK